MTFSNYWQSLKVFSTNVFNKMVKVKPHFRVYAEFLSKKSFKDSRSLKKSNAEWSLLIFCVI